MSYAHIHTIHKERKGGEKKERTTTKGTSYFSLIMVLTNPTT
jgi:hypothetical protein